MKVKARCFQCKKNFFLRWISLRKKINFCCYPCLWKYRKIAYKGISFSPRTQFKKGNKKLPNAYSWGKEEKNPFWKGDKVGYAGVHGWVESRLGCPKKCEHCGNTKKKVYHWANKSGKYKRDLNDWFRLCVKCHSAFDWGRIEIKGIKKQLKTRSRRIPFNTGGS